MYVPYIVISNQKALNGFGKVSPFVKVNKYEDIPIKYSMYVQYVQNVAIT